MKTTWLAIAACLLLAASPARADLCDSVKDGHPSAESRRDVAFHDQLFPDPTDRGSPDYNAIVLQCNRQRDTKGKEVATVTQDAAGNAGKRQLLSAELEPKVVRGHYNFFGTVVTQQKYVYVLQKSAGKWTMIIPYRPIIEDVVKDRIDLYVGRRPVDPSTRALGDLDDEGHAWSLFEASQVSGAGAKGTLKAGARPIAETLCATATYFPGKEGKYGGESGADAYKRDKENRFISLGLLQYRYEKDSAWVYEGCRVRADGDLYYRASASSAAVERVKPGDFVLDNFVRTAEANWSTGAFALKLLMKGRNDSDFPKAVRDLLRDDDHLTVRFATKFLPHHFNQMYKSNPVQFYNFSTMTSDDTYWHEVGHAFGLDDEYAGEEDGKKAADCHAATFTRLGSTSYQMCDTGSSEVRTVYHYVAVSRYVTRQSECQTDGDCDQGEFCDAGPDLHKNQCLPRKADGEACAAAGGGHQCKSGSCAWARCYTPGAVKPGGACFIDAACQQGKCSSIDGAWGTCVCKEDSECPDGTYCNAGLDGTKNACLPRKADGEACDVAGGGHQCKSGSCAWARCYTPGAVKPGGACFVDAACDQGKCSSIDGTWGTCVCADDGDCSSGFWCNKGLDLKKNTCEPKLAKGEKCGSAGSVGNDHKCKSGECSGFPKYVCK